MDQKWKYFLYIQETVLHIFTIFLFLLIKLTKLEIDSCQILKILKHFVKIIYK